MEIPLPLSLSGKLKTELKTAVLPLVKTDADNIGMYNFQVDWGDKSPIETIIAWDASEKKHTYTDDGAYTVTITGSLVGWCFGNPDKYDTNPHARKLIKVKQWGNLFWVNLKGSCFSELKT